MSFITYNKDKYLLKQEHCFLVWSSSLIFRDNLTLKKKHKCNNIINTLMVTFPFLHWFVPILKKLSSVITKKLLNVKDFCTMIIQITKGHDNTSMLSLRTVELKRGYTKVCDGSLHCSNSLHLLRTLRREIKTKINQNCFSFPSNDK